MQLERNVSLLSEFIELATKYQPYDATYTDLSHEDGVFNNGAVERAYIVFLYVRLADEESNLKKAFNFWREFHYGDSRRISVLFEFINAVNSDQVSDIWLNKWDAKDRNINLEREYLCRIFMLSGITARMSFERTGILT